MRTVEEIRGALARATTDQERSTLIAELEQAIAARSTEQPSALEQLRTRLTEAATERATLLTEYEQVTTNAVDGDGNAREFTNDEAEQRGRLSARMEQAEARHRDLEDQVRQGEHDEREQRNLQAVAQMRRELGLAEQAPNGTGIAGIREHRTYERGNAQSHLRDIVVQAFGPGLGTRWAQSRERLVQHSRENHIEALAIEERIGRMAEQERARARMTPDGYFLRQMIEQFSDRESQRGVSVMPGILSYRALSTASTAGGEFVPPMYLTEQWIAYLRAGRVVANCMHHEDLPDGTMSINIPKVQSGTTVAAQGTQNTNVSNTDLVTQFVTFPVVTFAGQQIVSLQLLERSPIQFDQVVMDDLARAHAAYVDQQVLNGTGSNGQITGLLNTSGITVVTWTQATPTIKGLYGQIGLAKQDVSTSIYLPATHCFITPNCWEWISQTFDGNSRPLVVPEYGGPFNAITVGDDPAVAEGAVGRGLNGLATFEDNNIPQTLGSGSNQDVAIICRAQEHYLYESPVVTRALPQTYGAQLSVLLQLYNYGAFTAARYPTATAAIEGTGMSTANRVFNS